MSLLQKVALVPDGTDIDPSELNRVAGALSKQVQRDFSPLWRIDAVVDAFTRLEDVEVDYWPIVIVRDVEGAAGYHEDKDGQPYALVQHDPDWSLTASHECLEMLADPFGRRVYAANLLDQAIGLGLPPNRVRYLVEVCDPSEAGNFAYHVNDILVSDFYTPHYFDPVKSSGVQYSFTGSINGPREVLDGGYISWQDLTNGHWMQLRMFPDQFANGPHVVDLSAQPEFAKFLESEISIRAAIDRVTQHPPYVKSVSETMLTAARVNRGATNSSRVGRAKSLREVIQRYRETAKKQDGGKKPK